MKAPPYLDNDYVSKHLSLEELIPALNMAYQSNDIFTAQKSKTAFGIDGENTVMIMPAVNRNYIGVKTLTIIPDNPRHQRLSHQGNYNLYDAKEGQVLCTMAAERLTSIRTACTSALAASKLARKNTETLLVIGNGAIACDMIRAHAHVRNYQTILFWGRDIEKSKKVFETLPQELQQKCTILSSLDGQITKADVISLATSASSPIISDSQISDGQHIDLVGSYKPDMQEVDPNILGRASVFVDDMEYTPSKAGELVEALKKNIIQSTDIKGDLSKMSQHDFLRQSNSEITVFKSSGMALQDLVSATMLYENWLKVEA